MNVMIIIHIFMIQQYHHNNVLVFVIIKDIYFLHHLLNANLIVKLIISIKMKKVIKYVYISVIQYINT